MPLKPLGSSPTSLRSMAKEGSVGTVSHSSINHGGMRR